MDIPYCFVAVLEIVAYVIIESIIPKRMLEAQNHDQLYTRCDEVC